jgi:hypothetical protein
VAPDRRARRTKRTPERRYADRRQSPAFRALVAELLKKGEIEIVETLWGRELRRIERPHEPPQSDTTETRS